MDKQFFVNVVNLETGKIFSLPTLYTDRTEACVCGQNYVRDRQAEDPSAELFFRVLIANNGQVEPDYYWDNQLEEEEEEDDETCPHPEQECCADCSFSSECWDFDGGDDEEPEHGESVFGGMLVAELIDLLKSKAPEAPEEPNYLFEHWND